MPVSCHVQNLGRAVVAECSSVVNQSFLTSMPMHHRCAHQQQSGPKVAAREVSGMTVGFARRFGRLAMSGYKDMQDAGPSPSVCVFMYSFSEDVIARLRGSCSSQHPEVTVQPCNSPQRHAMTQHITALGRGALA